MQYFCSALRGNVKSCESDAAGKVHVHISPLRDVYKDNAKCASDITFSIFIICLVCTHTLVKYPKLLQVRTIGMLSHAFPALCVVLLF